MAGRLGDRGRGGDEAQGARRGALGQRVPGRLARVAGHQAAAAAQQAARHGQPHHPEADEADRFAAGGHAAFSRLIPAGLNTAPRSLASRRHQG